MFNSCQRLIMVFSEVISTILESTVYSIDCTQLSVLRCCLRRRNFAQTLPIRDAALIILNRGLSFGNINTEE